jgi:hypothetical protein
MGDNRVPNGLSLRGGHFSKCIAPAIRASGLLVPDTRRNSP